jgi:hypothetical protein
MRLCRLTFAPGGVGFWHRLRSRNGCEATAELSTRSTFAKPLASSSENDASLQKDFFIIVWRSLVRIRNS